MKLLWLLACFLSPADPGSLQAQTGHSPPQPIPLPENETLHLAAGEQMVFLVRIPAGQVRSVSFQQRSGSIQVQWKPEGAASSGSAQVATEIRSNRSGKLSSITFHVLGFTADSTVAAVDGSASQRTSGANESDLRGSLVVQNQSKRAVEFRIVTGPLRAPNSNDAAILEAERDDAAALATPRTAAGAQQSLPLLQAAEKLWRATGMLVELTHDVALEVYNQAFPANDGAGALLRVPELLLLAAQIVSLDTAEAANARKTVAFVYAKQARYDDALTQYNGALLLFEQTSDTYNRVVVLENRAKIERIQAHYELALEDVERALPLARESGDAQGELALEVERGAIGSASGQLGVAYEADLHAASLAQTTANPYLEALAWSDLAVAYTEMHDFPEAHRALDHADGIWKSTQNPYGQLQTEEDRAELRLAEGDLSGARLSFASGAEAAGKSSLVREQSYFLRGLSVAEMRSGNFAEAQKHLDDATREAEQAHVNDTLSELYASSGDLEALQHRWPEAAAHWQRAATLADQQSNKLDQVVALGGLVRAALENGDRALAGERCGQAMTALESIRKEISDGDLRLSFFSSRHALYDLCVQTFLRGSNQEEAFDAAERGRARSLLDEAAAAGVLAELPTALMERLQRNQKELRRARSQIAVPNSPAKDVQARQNFLTLLKERDAVRVEAERSGLSGRLAADSLPLSEGEIVHKLDGSTALLAYWLGSSGSVVWMITSHGASVHALPPSRVLEESSQHYLASLLAPLALNQGASAQERSSVIVSAQTAALEEGLALRRTLLPMQISPKVKRLLIIKDGAILPISFSSLPLTRDSYLGTRFLIATEPSAAFAWRSLRAPPPFSQLRSVVFADPSESTHNAVRPNLHPPEIRRTAWTTPLPFARQEGQMLRETFGDRNTTIIAGAAATRANALGLDWTRFDVAHFATHAVFRQTHPELSGLVLAPASSAPPNNPGTGKESAGPPRDSLLSFYDVLQMKAPLQLVVLNACSSGMGKLLPGEGKLALDNAFLAAGAARVIATLWPVEDEASSVFMRAFYRSLARTHSPLLSLREAQRRMAEAEEWSAPYYWGAFTLTGDWHPFSN